MFENNIVNYYRNKYGNRCFSFSKRMKKQCYIVIEIDIDGNFLCCHYDKADAEMIFTPFTPDSASPTSNSRKCLNPIVNNSKNVFEKTKDGYKVSQYTVNDYITGFVKSKYSPVSVKSIYGFYTKYTESIPDELSECVNNSKGDTLILFKVIDRSITEPETWSDIDVNRKWDSYMNSTSFVSCCVDFYTGTMSKEMRILPKVNITGTPIVASTFDNIGNNVMYQNKSNMMTIGAESGNIITLGLDTLLRDKKRTVRIDNNSYLTIFTDVVCNDVDNEMNVILNAICTDGFNDIMVEDKIIESIRDFKNNEVSVHDYPIYCFELTKVSKGAHTFSNGFVLNRNEVLPNLEFWFENFSVKTKYGKENSKQWHLKKVLESVYGKPDKNGSKIPSYMNPTRILVNSMLTRKKIPGFIMDIVKSRLFSEISSLNDGNENDTIRMIRKLMYCMKNFNDAVDKL